MNKLKIREPIWKTKSIGIATFRVLEDLEITIAYKDKHGNKVFPGKYYLKVGDAVNYPISYCKGTEVYIVPIEELSRNG